MLPKGFGIRYLIAAARCGFPEKTAVLVEVFRIRHRSVPNLTGRAPPTRNISDQELPTVTGPELKQLRQDLGDALGQALTAADMARLCGLEPKAGADTIRRWEVTGPSGPAGKLLGILAMASDRHPILENFNTFDRWDVHERERPALREAFREKMRNEIRERLTAA
jgi:hypothetical protein